MAFTPNAPQSNTYDCQNCGAKLPPPTAEGTQTCLYCQAVYTVQREASNPQGFTIVFGSGSTTFGSSPAGFGSYPAPSSQAIDAMMNAGVKTAKWSLIFGLVITVIIIASVCIPLYFVFKDGFDFASTTGTPTVQVPGAGGIDFTFAEKGGVLLPGEPSAPAQVLQISSYYDQSAKESRSVMLKLDGATKAVAWKSTPFGEPTFGRTILTDGVNAYAPDGAKIRAIKLTDGTDVWSAPLSDKVSTSCADCVYLVGTTMVVRTDDGQVQAIDSTTGAPMWNRKVSDVRARPYPFGDRVLVLDGDKGEYAITIVNAADGAELGTIAPSCGDRTFNGIRPDSQVIPSILENAVYVGMGTSSACWQKFDLANPAAPVLDAPVEGGYLDTDDAAPVLAPGHILWTQRASGGAIGDFDLTTGTARLINEDEAVSYATVGVSGTNVIVRATTTRGTPKLSLRAIDIAAGTQVWEKALGEAESLDPPGESPSGILSDGDSVVSARVTPDGKIVIVTISATSSDTTAKAETIDGATGVVAGAPTAASLGKPLGSVSANLVGWSGSRVTVLAGGKVATLDAATGSLVGTIP